MIIGSKLYRMHTCDDSFAWAKSHINDAPDGSVFLADVLTKARGRHGRVWSVYPGQLIITILLKPQNLEHIGQEDLPIRLNQLNMALSLGILEPLKIYNVSLKWPNDFIFEDKKLGGMLMQLIWNNQAPAGIIVGFALNSNNIFSEDDPLISQATSLCSITGAPVDMRALYKQILGQLDCWYACWRDGKFDIIYKLWKNSQAFMQQRITVHQHNGDVISGVMEQVLPYGDMVIKLDSGKQQTVSFYQIENVSKA